MSFNFFRVNHANVRISGIRDIHLTQKLLSPADGWII